LDDLAQRKEIKTKRKDRINVGGQDIIFAYKGKIVQKATRQGSEKHKSRKYPQIEIRR
jgi:hypothetical protein